MEESMYPKPTISCEKGFSLVELSIVLVIVGLLISAGVGIMNSVNKSSKIAKEKANLEIIKNSLITYAFSHGRLPCPDTNGDGSENCPTSNCGNSPCGLPYVDLSISTVDKDTWSIPYGYDVTDLLTTTNSKNLCSTLYQLDNLYSWYGSPAGAACGTSNLVCVTDITDGDNGNIDSSGQGYYLAAYACSGGEDHVFGAKNSRDGRREYEMSSNAYDTTVNRDDMVSELSFGEMSEKICNNKNTTIDVGMSSGLVWYSDNDGCLVAEGLSAATVSLGQTVHYNNGTSDGCTGQVAFDALARCDTNSAFFAIPNCTTGASTFDGTVNLTIP
jgi:prepilin-type N-terminal cleavage/methylation domain-containing protein